MSLVVDLPLWHTGVGAAFAVVVVGWVLLKTPIKDVLVNLISWILNACLSRRYKIRSVNGNTSIPGCLYRFPNGQGDAAKFLHGKKNSEAWGKEYGSMFRIWSGMTPEIVLTHPEHIMAFFKDSHLHTKASSNNSGYFMGQILGQCLGLINGRDWRAVKECVERPFLRSVATSYLDLVQDRTRRHFEALWSSGSLSLGVLDPAEDFKMLPFLIVAEVIYGPLNSTLEQRLRDLAPERERLFHHVIRGGLSRFSFSHLLPTQANKDLNDFQKKWHQLNQDLYSQACTQSSSAPIIVMFRSVEEGRVTREQLYQTLDEMLFANLDVTIGGVSWNLVFLAANPKVQEQLRAEVLSRKSEGDLDGYLQNSASLLSACISESSRLRPLAAFSVPQAAPTDRVVGDYLIPAGTNAVVDAYALNIRDPLWGEDATTYRPSRFFEHAATELRYSYWRFGFGGRQCLGKYVADFIIRSLIAQLVSEYDLSMTKEGGDNEWKRIEDCWINHPDMRLRCVPRRRGPSCV